VAFPAYEVHVSDRDGDNDVVLPFGELSYTDVLDDANTCSFVVPRHHPDVTRDNLATLRRIVSVYVEGQLRFAGPLWYVNADTDQGGIKIGALGWFADLKKRYIEPPDVLTFVNTDVWDLAWAIIEYANAQYDLGITRGVPQQRGKLIDRTYPWWDKRTIASIEADIPLSRPFPYDFEITADKVWMTYVRRISDIINPDVVLEKGVNIDKLSYQESGDAFADQVFVWGFGSGADSHFAQASDDSLRPAYGLHQATWDRPGTRKQLYLNEAAATYLTDRRAPWIQPTVSVRHDAIPFDAYHLGQGLRVVYSDGFDDIDDYYRLVARTVRLTDAGREDVTLAFDSPSARLQ
jgi:hypothetical protein